MLWSKQIPHTIYTGKKFSSALCFDTIVYILTPECDDCITFHMNFIFPVKVHYSKGDNNLASNEVKPSQ